jgi:hypothetical protein
MLDEPNITDLDYPPGGDYPPTPLDDPLPETVVPVDFEPATSPVFTPPAASDGGSFLGIPASDWREFGVGLQFGAGLTAAVSAYYGAEARKSELGSRALDADFAALMSDLNSRAAEFQIGVSRVERDLDAARVTEEYGDQMAGEITSAGARGVTIGQGSAAEVAQSVNRARARDLYAINIRGVREENRLRREAINLQIQGRMARVSARNLRRTAGSVSPFGEAAGTVLGALGGLARSYGRGF